MYRQCRAQKEHNHDSTTCPLTLSLAFLDWEILLVGLSHRPCHELRSGPGGSDGPLRLHWHGTRLPACPVTLPGWVTRWLSHWKWQSRAEPLAACQAVPVTVDASYSWPVTWTLPARQARAGPKSWQWLVNWRYQVALAGWLRLKVIWPGPPSRRPQDHAACCQCTDWQSDRPGALGRRRSALAGPGPARTEPQAQWLRVELRNSESPL